MKSYRLLVDRITTFSYRIITPNKKIAKAIADNMLHSPLAPHQQNITFKHKNSVIFDERVEIRNIREIKSKVEIPKNLLTFKERKIK